MHLSHFLWNSLLLFVTIAREVIPSNRNLQFDSPKENLPQPLGPYTIVYQPTTQQPPIPMQQPPMPMQQPSMQMQQPLIPIQPPSMSAQTQQTRSSISQQQAVGSQSSEQLSQKQTSYPSAPPSQPPQPFSQFVQVSSQTLSQHQPLQLPPPPTQKIVQWRSLNKDSTSQLLPSSQQLSQEQLEQQTPLQAAQQNLLQHQSSLSPIVITPFQKFLYRLQDISVRVKPFVLKVKAYLVDCKEKISDDQKSQLESFLEEQVRFHTEVKGFVYDFKHEEQLSLVDKMRLQEAAFKLFIALKTIKNKIRSVEGQTRMKRFQNFMKGFFKAKDKVEDQENDSDNEMTEPSKPKALQSVSSNQASQTLGTSHQVLTAQVSTAAWSVAQNHIQSPIPQNVKPQAPYTSQQYQPVVSLATSQYQGPELVSSQPIYKLEVLPGAKQQSSIPSVGQSPAAPTAPPPSSLGPRVGDRPTK